MGAGLPRKLAVPQDRAADVDMVKSYDFAGAIQVLRGNDGRLPPSLPGSESPANTHGVPFNNTLLILGAESATVYQRVPVPIGMWQPFAGTGVPLRLNAPGILTIDGQRVAVLICYEQMLTFPILASMLQRSDSHRRYQQHILVYRHTHSQVSGDRSAWLGTIAWPSIFLGGQLLTAER